MEDANNEYSTVKITPTLISRIVDALRDKAYGSVEIYVENCQVVQITERSITKLAKSNNNRKRFSITLKRNGAFSPRTRPEQ